MHMRLLATRLARGWAFAAAVLFVATATSAQATGVPDALSYEYFGISLNAANVLTSNTVGTLDYTGHGGCGGICYAKTSLGPDPSVSLSAPQASDMFGGGGYAEAALRYFFRYDNTPGTYTIHIRVSDGLNISSRATGQNLLIVGQPNFDSLRSFGAYTSIAIEESHCENSCGLYRNYALTAQSAPFYEADLELQANTIYSVTLDTYIEPSADNSAQTSFIDPTFTASAPGGVFVFSNGVTAADVPEPTSLGLTLGAIAGLSVVSRVSRHRRMGSARAR